VRPYTWLFKLPTHLFGKRRQMCSYMSSDSAPCLHARRQSKALNQWFEKLEMLTGMAQLDLLMRKDATEAGKDTFLKTDIIVVIIIIADHHLSSQSAYHSSIPISLPLTLSVRLLFSAVSASRTHASSPHAGACEPFITRDAWRRR